MGFKSFMFGGGTTGPKFKIGGAENQAMGASTSMMGNMLGADQTGWYDEKRFGKTIPTWDFSKTGKPITVSGATSQYGGFSDLDKAISSFGAGPEAFTQKYDPSTYSKYKFSFADPDAVDRMTNARYGLMSSDLRREGAGQQEAAQEALGARALRSPGLLLKQQQAGSRNLLETLAKGRTGMEADAQGQKLSMAQAQQQAQAAENLAKFGADTGEAYKGYQSRSDLERSNAENKANYLRNYFDSAREKIATQAGITDADKNRQMQQLQIAMNAFMGQQSSRRGSQKSGGGGALGTIIGAGTQAAKSFAGG